MDPHTLFLSEYLSKSVKTTLPLNSNATFDMPNKNEFSFLYLPMLDESLYNQAHYLNSQELQHIL